VTIGHESYIFGGRNETKVTDSVVEFNLTTHVASYAPITLPEPRMSSSVAYDRDSGNVYILAGSDGPSEKDTVYRFVPKDGKIDALAAKVPHPRVGSAAAWSNHFIYLFGGHSNGTMLKEIVKFDPKTLNVTVLKAELPSGRAGMSIAPTPTGIYLFGGNTDAACSANGALDEVLRFDPRSDNLTKMSFKLPYPMFHASGAWTGQKAYFFGGSAVKAGQNVSQATDTIVEFDYASNGTRVIDVRLPSPRERTASSYSDGCAYVFGGQSGVTALDEVVLVSLGGECGQKTNDIIVPLTIGIAGLFVLVAVTIVWSVYRRGRK
jgi:hypothetical protein